MAKRHLGQNFLYDPSILRRIIQVAQLNKEDLVVEIGPGPGMLTRMLAERVKRVIAIELDEKLFEKLQIKLIEYNNVEIIHGDALKYNYENLPEFKVVANIPYYITTPILFRLLELKQICPTDTQKTLEVIPPSPPLVKGGRGDFQMKKNLKTITLTVQKEVAERIAASPGGKDYGVLSIMVQYYAKPGLKFIIPKGSFRPVPRVDSAVVHMKILEQPPVDVKDERFFFRIVKTAFSQRRKMLSNALRSIREDIKERLDEAGIDSHRRPETLSIEEFAHLADIIKN
ncbi:MAG: 16S rRNA (adenine(1518)-N(6)/adenine(1519)-N(6))-dimethyltransferase [Nitrospira sp.]|nr:16S rRNA (adenine(1518)-N(6)/adenine(1519)-N(6))-dimethyltransferase [Nitrospira sp.]